MMFVDGILQAILQEPYYYGESNWLSRTIIKTDFLTFVYLDLFLLENQLPYRVLELLITSSSSSKKGLSMRLIEGFIEANFVTIPEEMEQRLKQEEEPIDFSPRGFRKAKELRNSGTWFKQSENDLLTDFSFSRTGFIGKLWLPPIRVDESTGPMFMNLIAYEMCPDLENDSVVTSYVCFLDSLIDDAGDVQVLRDDGAVYNALGSDEEVAKLLNKMSTVSVPNPEIYYDVKRQVQQHCPTKWIRHAAQAYLTYFSSPWTFIAFVAAIAVLFLSSLQTYYTIISAK
ncbi:hypothetical protein F3Y22_tig00004041pilonHSYRG00040 [Hibiscus syriacus]|uniref:Uncharacterized protein n=1 Tax=Hibiscus syriacus TaxID=106335 RepID=A0A6A3CHM5_HIBSY|nr:putative UPF0481 protein At3g02645 [Hibiscus syriacus]KAE8728935.1 hypothetical protein F3Y22_tig00004041pilonHSYRG00040 [Hibiscus syriacus]